MGKILVTGATGNVGKEVIKNLQANNIQTVSAVYTEQEVQNYKNGQAARFDFGDSKTWEPALNGVDKVFLMRPPAISDVKTYLFPFIDYMLENNIKHIAFLSLQGVQFNFLTPHFKVEKYLKKKKAPYTFIRPNFFMQNISTFYRDDVAQSDELFVPAGTGKTAFVDARDLPR